MRYLFSFQETVETEAWKFVTNGAKILKESLRTLDKSMVNNVAKTLNKPPNTRFLERRPREVLLLTLTLYFVFNSAFTSSSILRSKGRVQKKK